MNTEELNGLGTSCSSDQYCCSERSMTKLIFQFASPGKKFGSWTWVLFIFDGKNTKL